MSSDFLVEYSTAFHRPFVPPRCRLERVECLLHTGMAVVPQIDRAAAKVAFRIRYPYDLRFTAMTRENHTVDVLAFAGKIFWPCGEHLSPEGMGIVHRFNGADEWRKRIGAERDLLKVIPRGVTTVAAESPSRVELPDKRDETMAQVQRALVENYLVCDGAIYAVGGVPVHALWRGPRSTHVTVVGSGADRRVTDFCPICVQPGFVARPETQSAFAEGMFWLPGTLAAATLPTAQRDFPQIEVVAPELIPADLAYSIQIDALFRQSARTLGTILRTTTAPGSAAMPHYERYENDGRFRMFVRDAFQNAVASSADGRTTSSKRLEALRALFKGTRTPPRKNIRIVKALETSFKDLDSRYSHWDLAPEDLAALDDLAP